MHILIIDDHPLYIRGIQALLFELDPMIVTSGAGSVEEGLALSKDIEFGLVLLDLKLPGMNDLDALRITKRRLDAIPVVVMSGNENPESIWRAVEMGAAGYIPKDTAQSLTVHALQTVLARGVYLPDDLFGSHPASDGRPLPGFSNRPYLSERQLAVLASLLRSEEHTSEL